MRSGTGRHRRPKQPPAFVVAAGVTGAGIALPLLGAASANAVSPDTWDAAAACESGGVWTANTDNGYYGGLQIPLAQWEAHGGTDFAERPDLASRAQQIKVAERMLAAQGRSAFPSCALTTGLWQEFRADAQQAAPETDAGDAESAEGAGQAEDARGSGSGGTESGIGESTPGETARDSAGSGSGTDRSADASADTPGDTAADEKTGQGTGKPAGSATGEEDGAAADEEGTGRHRGEAADEQDGRAGENADGTGRHAERPADRAGERTEADADGAGDATAPEAAEGTTAAGSYEVISGDTLSQIADTLTVEGGWPALYAANESVIGDNPDHIVPGLELELGAKAD
ncbi:LysM peptidoglycan-binding domain-containing protein [Streptomyces harbinensis]|uniref:LysM peptidoglycan-binding domain-containing protein n=1 Tax=Streptomyces harbinensis TaxID=1176198 RepID=UPI003680776B